MKNMVSLSAVQGWGGGEWGGRPGPGARAPDTRPGGSVGGDQLQLGVGRAALDRRGREVRDDPVVDRVVGRVVVHDAGARSVVARWAGTRSAVRIRSISSMRLERCLAPAEETTFSSSMIEPRSSAP